MAESPPNDPDEVQRLPLSAALERTWAETPLPAPITSFVGRDDDVGKVAALVLQDGVRLVTLTGPAGVGKTRLALRVAHELNPQFAGRVLFVPLAQVRDPEVVAKTVAERLGTSDLTGRELRDRLRGVSLLLVVDNVEHVLDGARRLKSLLAEDNGLRLLVTGRRPLALAGENVWRVRPLGVRASTSSDAAELSEAATLFLDRAGTYHRDFTQDVGEVSVVEEICAVLDGLPLAIELAAARVPLLSLGEMLQDLRDRKTSILQGETGASSEHDFEPDHHASMTATIAWSYDLLDGVRSSQRSFLKTLLRCLSVFAGRFTRNQADAVFRASQAELATRMGQTPPLRGFDIVGSLGILVNDNLVIRENRMDDEGRSRYTMLERIREYGTGRFVEDPAVNPNEETAVRRCHAVHFLSLIETDGVDIPEPELGLWLKRAEREQDNLRVALQWALDSQSVDIAVRLATSLGQFWDLRDHFEEGLRRIEEAIAAAEAAPGVVVPPTLFYWGGTLAYQLGDGKEAERLGRRLLGLARDRDDRLGATIGHGLISLGLSDQGRHGDSGRAAQDGLNELRGLDADSLDEHGRRHYQMLRARMLNRMATELQAQAALSHSSAPHAKDAKERKKELLNRALEYYQEALDIRRSIQQFSGILATLSNLGMVSTELGDLSAALEHHRVALERTLEIGQQWHACLNLIGMSYLAAKGYGDYEAAARFLSAADRLIEEHEYGLWVHWKRGREETEANCKSALSDEKFKAARAQGYELEWREAANGAIAYSLRLHAHPPEKHRKATPYGLSQRELEVMELVAAGKENPEIADALYISPRTVTTHVNHILEKTESNTRAEAAVKVARALGNAGR